MAEKPPFPRRRAWLRRALVFLVVEVLGQEVLKRSGVPTASIRLIEQPILDTEEEVQVIVREARSGEGER